MRRGAVAALLSGLLAACAGPPQASPPPAETATPVAVTTPPPSPRKIRVALVADVGGLDDRSFNAMARTGLLEAQARLGAEVAVAEPKDAASYAASLTGFAQRGFDLTIAVGLSMANATWRVAKQFPSQRFAIVDSAPADDGGKIEQLPNVAHLLFREQDAGYVTGVIAGEMLRARVGRATTGTACALGALPIPQVDRYLAGYQEALERYGAILILGYAVAYGDPGRGREIGRQHISQGCSILFQAAGNAGLGYIDAARERGLYAIGSDADQAHLAPHTMLASAVKRVDVAVFLTAQALREARFHSGDNVFSAENDAIGFGTLHPDVPDAARRAAAAGLADLKSGRVRARDAIKK